MKLKVTLWEFRGNARNSQFQHRRWLKVHQKWSYCGKEDKRKEGRIGNGMRRVQIIESSKISRVFLLFRLQFLFSPDVCLYLRVYIYIYVVVNKPFTHWLCVQYTLFMIANVCVSTELLFSLVGLLGLVPLRGALTLLSLKDHPSKPGNQMAFVQYVKTDVDAKACLSRRFRSCIAVARILLGKEKYVL